MTVLFSPVGTADPITQLGDGPMLHIIRHCKPHKVVLFFSPAMASHQREDERYTRAIEKLAHCAGVAKPQIEIIESGYKEVYRFDYYIGEFEEILAELARESDGETVLVNVSSGTPGMAQALVALGSFGHLNIALLQVTTPRRDVNSRNDREDPKNYDLESLWEWNEEIQGGSENRIQVVDTPNFGDRLLRENAIAFIRQYDYAAAYELAARTKSVDPVVKEMIKATADRLNLEGRLSTKVFGSVGLGFRSDLLAEYLSVMEVRLAQEHWADFVRCVTPALTSMMKRCLSPYLPEKAYLRIDRKGNITDVFDFTKIERDDRLHRALEYECCKRSRYPGNASLMKLVDEYCKDDVSKRKIRELRDMEEGCRNRLAHTLTSSSRQAIEKEGGLNLDTAMRYLFELHGNVKLGLYDRINDAIIERI